MQRAVAHRVADLHRGVAVGLQHRLEPPRTGRLRLARVDDAAVGAVRHRVGDQDAATAIAHQDLHPAPG
jgi:hypothetical protein